MVTFNVCALYFIALQSSYHEYLSIVLTRYLVVITIILKINVSSTTTTFSVMDTDMITCYEFLHAINLG